MWLARSFYYWYASRIYSADYSAVAAIMLQISFFSYEINYLLVDALHDLVVKFQKTHDFVLVVCLIYLENVTLLTL